MKFKKQFKTLLLIALAPSLLVSCGSSEPEEKKEEETPDTREKAFAGNPSESLSENQNSEIVSFNMDCCDDIYYVMKPKGFDGEVKKEEYTNSYKNNKKTYKTHLCNSVDGVSETEREGISCNFGEKMYYFAVKEDYADGIPSSLQLKYGQVATPKVNYLGTIGEVGKEYRSTYGAVTFSCETEGASIYYDHTTLGLPNAKSSFQLKKDQYKYDNNLKSYSTTDGSTVEGKQIEILEDYYCVATKENYFDSDFAKCIFKNKIPTPTKGNVNITNYTHNEALSNSITFQLYSFVENVTIHYHLSSSLTKTWTDEQVSGAFKIPDGPITREFGSAFYIYLFLTSNDDTKVDSIRSILKVTEEFNSSAGHYYAKIDFASTRTF